VREPPLILVVDDVPDNVDILQMRLESQGYEVVTASMPAIASPAPG